MKVLPFASTEGLEEVLSSEGVGRTHSLPSDAYKRNWEHVFSPQARLQSFLRSFLERDDTWPEENCRLLAGFADETTIAVEKLRPARVCGILHCEELGQVLVLTTKAIESMLQLRSSLELRAAASCCHFDYVVHESRYCWSRIGCLDRNVFNAGLWHGVRFNPFT